MKRLLLSALVASFVSFSWGIALGDKPQPPASNRKPTKSQQVRDRQPGGPARAVDGESLGDVIEMLHALQDQVQELKEEVALFRKEVGQPTRDDKEARLGRVDLAGNWRMTLPRGYQYEVTLEAQGDNLYRLEFPGNSSGVYRHKGSRLSMDTPRDKRLTEFVWQLQNKNLLVLVESPPTAKTGADYRDAVMHRIRGKGPIDNAPPR